MRRKSVNYLNNKDMMHEIHWSKISYCEYVDSNATFYDFIVEDLSDLTVEDIETAKKNRADRIAEKNYHAYLAEDEDDGRKPKDFRIDPSEIDPMDLVIRCITWEHIPLHLERKRTHKTEADRRTKLNFVPFMHYSFKSPEHMQHAIKHEDFEKSMGIVLRSHYKDGKFSKDHGQITDKLSRMYMMMVKKYAEKGNWRGYSYIEDMKGRALIELASKGLFFNELKSSNPFSYLTQVITNGFRIVLNDEKKNQNIRDDLLEQSGQAPSIARQIKAEENIRHLRDDANDDRPF